MFRKRVSNRVDSITDTQCYEDGVSPESYMNKSLVSSPKGGRGPSPPLHLEIPMIGPVGPLVSSLFPP